MKTQGIVSAIVTTVLAAAAPAASVAAEPRSENELVQANLKRFDQLDLDAYSRRKDNADLHVLRVTGDNRNFGTVDAHCSSIASVHRCYSCSGGVRDDSDRSRCSLHEL